MQKVIDHQNYGYQLLDYLFQALFHSLLGSFFNFPSRYFTLSPLS